ncbi:unnamed protein product [Strongylus vulgaris]|uniref:EGF-like domain-containing protein n=1 Tax=Strongylus vulgaris TaxID=40348 RepID=A0A3P7JDQ8_STRVU|nr:unnamed protein product [Strongylus vulgaris]
MQRKSLVLFCVLFCIAEAVKDNAITIRAKRQECKCVPNNAAGGLTCSCSKGAADNGVQEPVESIQQAELAHELTNNIQMYPHGQTRCGCLQIVFLGNPQYQCQCGDGHNPYNPVQTTTTPVPTTTTMAPTTTTRPPVDYPPIPTVTEGPGHCQCVMIRISGPASAQYQCNCDNSQVRAFDGNESSIIKEVMSEN